MKYDPNAPILPEMSSPMRTASYWLSGVLLALAAALILEGAFHLRLLVAWLLCINAFSFLFCAIDKLNADYVQNYPAEGAKKVRIPEWSLLLLSLAGGSVGGLLAVLVCNHKADEAWFVFRLLAILVAQGVALYLLWDKIQLL